MSMGKLGLGLGLIKSPGTSTPPEGGSYPDPVFIGAQTTETNLTNYSFNSIDISAAAEHAARWLLIGVQAEWATGSAIPDTVTIDIDGGASAVPAELVFSQGTNYANSIWAVECPSGSTIDVNVNFGSTRQFVVLPIWALYTGADPAECYSVGAADPASVTLTSIDRIQLGGGNTFVISQAMCIDSAALYTCTYTGANSLTVNERVNAVMNSTYNCAWWDATPSTTEADASFEWEQTGAAATMYGWAVVFTIGPAAVDPFAADVVFLANFNGADNATSYSEETANAYAGTFTGTAKLSAAPSASSPYEGATSLYIGNSPGANYVTFDDAPIPLIDFTEPWCIEFAFNLFNTAGNQYMISQWDNVNNERSWAVYWAGTALGFYYSTTGANFITVTANVTGTAGVWYKAAAQFDGTNVRIWHREVHSSASAPGAAIHTPAADVKLMLGNRKAGDLQFQGSIDRLRITKGNYRYGMLDSYAGPARFPAVA